MKKFFYGMIALLSVSLFFMGCPTDTDDTTDTGKTESGTKVDSLVLTTLFAAPETGVASVNTFTGNTQYSGAVVWKYGTDNAETLATGANFAGKTVYTAVVTLAAKEGFTFTGVAKDAFSYAGTGVTAKNDADSGVVTVVFPETGPTPEQAAADLATALGANATSSGTTVTLTGTADVPGVLATPTVVPAGVTLATGTGSLSVAAGKALRVEGTISGTGGIVTTGTGKVILANTTAADNLANLKWALGKAGTGKILTLDVAEDASLDDNAIVPAGATVTVVAEKTLTVESTKTLTVNGILNVEGSLDGAVSGSTTATVIVGASPASIVYSVGDDDVTIPAGTYVWAADAGGGTAGWLENVSSSSHGYTVSQQGTVADTTSALSVGSVWKNPLTDTVILKLAGTFAAAYIYTANASPTADVTGTNWDDDEWGDGVDYASPDGVYGAVNIGGLFPLVQSNIAIHIKPYAGLLFYTGNPYADLNNTNVLTGPSLANPFNHLSATESENERWKLYESFAASALFDVLLYSEATDKTVTLDIDTYSAYTSAATKVSDYLNVIIDYTDVNFTAAP
jgi:hypothetical protein